MKPSKIALIIFAFICLIFEAGAQYNQYTLMRRGEVSQYDSSVNIDLPEYRLIRLKVLTADSLIAELHAERSKAEMLANLIGQKEATLLDVARRDAATIARKEELIVKLNEAFDELAAINKKLRIFNDPTADTITKVVIGAGLGYAIGKL